MRLIRYIHPVGQGAFYTEQFFGDSGQILATVVYDCGTNTNKAGIEREIKGQFVGQKNDKENVIDILFISHFHSDHINGIIDLKKRTSINNVVIPLYDQEMQLLLLGTIKANDKNYEQIKMLVSNPKEFFGNETRIIKVKSVDFEVNDNTDNIDALDIDEDASKEEKLIHSERPIIKKLDSIYAWEYIPFNFRYKERRCIFESECNNNNISLDNLRSKISDPLFVSGLRKVYDKISPKNSINENSMMVYSGLCETKDAQGRSSIPIACLYTGDASFNDEVISQLSTKFQQRFIDISMFQLPHHASKISFNIKVFDLLSYNMTCPVLFVCCGNKNTYGHPSPYVITQCNLFLGYQSRRNLIDQQGISFIAEQSVKIVSEDKNSMLVLQYVF